ncbi:hypothetical protein Poli38472_010567 [Pythium oligandrum]|uniref:GOST seven transmembrane domain-containing protein n=1 Tax=Pythium oligandrum TaxID=41045 RepID=A0A8K1C3D8_PYTOL|nr:hypothetical protein Poli38472_010567 [Pythium oligandrum]|eukprot:TMW55685.1 hypothetical protein Poli38472_010567 [Pythium oligandrum]
MVLFAWLLSAPSIDALHVSFARFFRYENRAQEVVKTTNITSSSGKNTTVKQGSAYSYGMGALIRWNTYSILSTFGIEAGGRVEFEVTNLTYVAFPPKYSSKRVPVVFTLYDNDQWRAYSVLQLRELPLRSPTILCHYPSMLRHTFTDQDFKSGNTTHRVVFDVTKSSQYTLQVQVCGDASVFVAGNAMMVNVGFDQQLSEHLPVEDLGRIPLYKAIIVIYSILTALWIIECFLRRKIVPKINHAFQMALHCKLLEIFVKLWYFHELSLRGQPNIALKATQNLAESTANAVFLAVMLLAALGWSLTRDQLYRRERRLIGLMYMVYFFVASLKAMCDSEEDVCKVYMLTEYLIRSIMMLGVIVSLNFTISQIRLALTEARWNHHVTPLTYMKLNQFMKFRYVFLVYLLIPTSLLIMNLLVLTPPGSWRQDWVNYFLGEACILVMYVSVGIILRPLDSYTYARISRGTRTANSSAANELQPQIPRPDPFLVAREPQSPLNTVDATIAAVGVRVESRDLQPRKLLSRATEDCFKNTRTRQRLQITRHRRHQRLSPLLLRTIRRHHHQDNTSQRCKNDSSEKAVKIHT